MEMLSAKHHLTAGNFDYLNESLMRRSYLIALFFVSFSSLLMLSLSAYRSSKKQEIKEPLMVLIPGGAFKMGSANGSDSKPVHKVFVRAFYLATKEVTNAEFVEFLNNIQTEIRNEEEVFFQDKQIYDLICDGFCSDWEAEIYLQNGRFKVRTGQEHHPVTLVSWYGATAYTKWLSQRTGKSYRLPTEEEWEYAAGGGKAHQKWAGTNNSGKKLSQYANLCDQACAVKSWRYQILNDGYAYTAPVGSFKPNKFGLYDMTGNAHEWCSSRYFESYIIPEHPSQKPEDINYVFRGGSWINKPTDVLTSSRFTAAPDYCTTVVGFRLAKSK